MSTDSLGFDDKMRRVIYYYILIDSLFTNIAEKYYFVYYIFGITKSVSNKSGRDLAGYGKMWQGSQRVTTQSDVYYRSFCFTLYIVILHS